MNQSVTIKLSPETVHNRDAQIKAAAMALSLDGQEISGIRVLRRSLDARGKNPLYVLKVEIFCGEPEANLFEPVPFRPVTGKKRVAIVGSGPSGLFAALELIRNNIRPVIIERGKDVKNRRFDLKPLNINGICDPDSNYCFGEGGAGTYSDGKLYTRSTKRGNIRDILCLLVQHGASPDILIDAHPHIGSNQLPKIIAAIRETILNNGGEIHFNERVIDLILSGETIKSGNTIKGVRTKEKEYLADAVILATGHSARDIYYLLNRKRILLEAKPYAMGVRVEHPQELINTIQYGRHAGKFNLPTASYFLSGQFNQAGVYSFCMCPGGMIVPAATSSDELVLNGMSNSKRNMPNANAGIVVTVDERLWHHHRDKGPLAGLAFQQEIEKKAFEAGNGTMAAPAQRLPDFLSDKLSKRLPRTSYLPGTVSYPVKEVLGPFITDALKQGFEAFGRKMRGFITETAQILAVESRTSSPVRIPRNPKSRSHPEIENLYPAGEGAGYAGGIVSSALDGQITAKALSGWTEHLS
nr:FAD-dependent oxidoreductase [uncultured Desulfobacter sp.]